MVALGSKGDEVIKLQRRLNELGYKDNGNAMLSEDGSFGPKTEQAVNKFKDSVLPGGNIDDNRGKVGDTTWEHLDKAVPLQTRWVPPHEYNEGKPWGAQDIIDFTAFENGQKLQWEGCVSKLITIRNNFEIELKRRGWGIRYTSAYRPLIYQAHFYDIKNGPTSKTSVGQTHCAQHGIKSASYPRRTSSPHILGVAWDCTVIDASGKQLNPDSGVNSELLKLAYDCGLRIATPNDNVHFELLNK